MTEEFFEKIIKSHKSEGMIEEANLCIKINQEEIFYNKFIISQ